MLFRHWPAFMVKREARWWADGKVARGYEGEYRCVRCGSSRIWF
jgi:hypothetical protein